MENQTKSLKQLLDAFQKSVNRDKQPEQVAATCYECNGSGAISYGSGLLTICPQCQGQRMIVVTR